MKTSEYLIVAAVSVAAVYVVNHFMGNFTVATVVAANSPSGKSLA